MGYGSDGVWSRLRVMGGVKHTEDKTHNIERYLSSWSARNMIVLIVQGTCPDLDVLCGVSRELGDVWY